ncbi:MAG: TlpA disulfide reductase family protein [Bacteroidales bacterium]|nr:TlpA disulfide reductase family protein [Bacteroidales bacterium]
MKIHKLSLLFLVIAMASCQLQKPENQYNIQVQINGVDGQMLMLERRSNDNWVKLDSVVIEKGAASFSGKTDAPEMFFLSIKNQKGYLMFFAEASEISIVAEPVNMKGAVVNGSASHDRFQAFNKGVAAFDEQLYAVYEQYQQAQANQDSLKMKETETLYNETDSNKRKYLIDFIKTNNSDIVSHYLLHRNSHQFELEELEGLVNQFDQNITSEYLTDLRKRVVILQSVAVGQPFVDFSLENPSGEMVSLSDKVGTKLLLVDFWAAWCQPCRRENPNIVAIYNDYKDKGFDVFGVSLDNDKAKWIEAIASDKLTWTQVSDLAGWGSSAGKLYGVQSIPHSVLLDENGIIIAKNLREDALREKVASILN